ncbi:MAG: putative Na+-dependent transporter [Glaciecola sp.]|jgi:BASS family bile acid:Na+ symporter
MNAVITFIIARSPLLLIGSILLGLFLPGLAEFIRPYVVPTSVIMVPLSVLRIDMMRLAGAVRSPTRVLLAAAMVLVGLPLMVGGVAIAIGLPPWMATGLVLIAAAPPLSSAAAFAILLRIDAALVTAISLCATLAAPLTLWLVTTSLPGLGDGVDITSLVLRLAGFLVFAFVTAFLIRRVFGETIVRRTAPQIDALTVLLVMVIGVGVMHEIGQSMRSDVWLWAYLFAATWLVSILSCAMAVGVFWRLGRDFALATGVAAAVKNIALMVAAVAPVVEPNVLLVVMTAQLPTFIAPLILRPVFSRL